MEPQKRRSKLKGELGQAVDAAIDENDNILREIQTYRGYGLVLTENALLLVVGGVLAGLKAHEQHVERLRFDEIKEMHIVPESAGCLNLFGIPPGNLVITPYDKEKHHEKWDMLCVDFPMIGEAVKIACHVHEQIGRQKAMEQKNGNSG